MYQQVCPRPEHVLIVRWIEKDLHWFAVTQEALEIVAEHAGSGLEQARDQLLQTARERWAAIQGGRTCDDITAVVVKLHAKPQATPADA